MKKIQTNKVNYIKLGRGGSWTEECIKENKMKLGYEKVLHKMCVEERWNDVEKYLDSTDRGAITRHVNQIKEFYKAPEEIMWITFYGGKLYWGFANEKVYLDRDGKRKCRDIKWNNKDISDNEISEYFLSGKITQVKSFRGTICEMRYREELLRRINCEQREEAKEIEKSMEKMVPFVEKLIRNLHDDADSSELLR